MVHAFMRTMMTNEKLMKNMVYSFIRTMRMNVKYMTNYGIWNYEDYMDNVDQYGQCGQRGLKMDKTSNKKALLWVF